MRSNHRRSSSGALALAPPAAAVLLLCLAGAGFAAVPALDPELVDLCYADLKGSAEDWRSAGVFGPETAPSGKATQAKLLALTGR